MNAAKHKAAVSLLMISVATAMMGTSPAAGEFVFGEPQNPGPPINTSPWDWALVISPDNLQMYVNSDRPGGSGYFDIWRSTREHPDDPWEPLVNVQEINGPYNESFPCFSTDGLTLYFSDWYTWNTAGDRPGGTGDHDLWMRTRSSADHPWGPPVNMGAIVNSPAGEVSPCISEDGRNLIFASKRSGGLGDYDHGPHRKANGVARSIWGPRSIAVPLMPKHGSHLVDWPCSSVPTAPAAWVRMTCG